MTESERISRAWGRVRSWLEGHLPEVVPLLRPGASDQQIEVLERGIGHPLPAGWSQLWKENNGQLLTADAPGLLAGWWFLSIEDLSKEWRDWAQIRDRASPSLMLASSHTSDPPDAIEEVYSDAGWIPVAKEPWEGNYVGIDFNPGPAGRSGQIINFGRDEDAKHVLATGLPELLEWAADAFEAGHILVTRAHDKLMLSHRDDRLSAALGCRCARTERD